MEKVQLVHNCLTFQLSKRKYVYGITYSILMSNFLSKFKPDFIIIPSHFYVNAVFLHAGVGEMLSKLAVKNNKEEISALDRILKFTKLIVVDEKKIQSYYPTDIVTNLLQKFQLSFFKQHDLDEKKLIKLHLELMISLLTAAYPSQVYLCSQLLEWINCPSFQLKIIVPESGMTTYLCQGTDIMAVDPTEQFVNYLKYNSIMKGKQQAVDAIMQKKEHFRTESVPTLIRFLKSIVVTKMATITAVLGLMLVEGVGKISVIVISQQLQEAIVHKSRAYLRFPEEVTRSRLQIKNIGHTNMPKPMRYPMIPKLNNPFSLQSPSTLNCSFYPLSQQSQPYLQFTFGSSIDIKTNKRIIFYTPSSVFSTETQPEAELTHFPYLLKEDTVDLVILYKLSEEIMKQLKGLPQPLRKKIILNRNQHKYNHKYFITFQKNKIEHCLVADTQYIQLMTFKKVMKSPVQSIENVLQNLKNKEVVIKNISKNKNGTIITMKSIQPGAKVYEMGHCAEIQTIGQAVQILDGIAKLWLKRTKKTAIIGGSGFKSQYFHQVQKIQALKFAQIKTISESDFEILMNFNHLRVGQSSQPNKNPELEDLQQISTISENSLIECLSLSQQKQLNKICRPVTYEVGFKTNNYNQNVYFISKGGMKWEDNDEVAGNGYFIGDLKSYYAMKEGLTQHFDNYIEVVKDTWAVEINIEEFHQFFIMEHPHILSIIHSKGKIFR